MKICTADEVKACFEKFLRKVYRLSKADAQIASYDLLDEDIPYLRRDWITTETIENEEYGKYIVYTDFSCTNTFPNKAHRFVFYELKNQNWEKVYSLDIDPQDIEDYYDFIKKWN